MVSCIAFSADSAERFLFVPVGWTNKIPRPPLVTAPLSRWGEGFFSFVCLIFSFYLREKVAARSDEGIPQNFPFQLNCTITKTLTTTCVVPPLPLGEGFLEALKKPC